MDAHEAELRVEGATDQHELLFALVAWWQLLRHARIATLVDVLASRLAVDRGPIDTKRRPHAEWLTVAKQRDPVDIQRLVAALWHANPEQAFARLAALAERDDPQVAPALLALLQRDCARWRNARALWDRVVAIVIDARDVRMHEAITAALPHVGAALRSRTGDRLHGELEDARTRIPREDPQLDAAADKLLGSLERELGVSPRRRAASLDELLEQVYAEPDADGPREVYADAIGGAIGELIIRQLRSTEPPPDLVRERHGRVELLPPELVAAILGPLRGLAYDQRIVRGFAEQLAIAPRTSAIRRHVGLPSWALVTHLVLGLHDDTGGRLVHLLGHAVMSRVRALRSLDGARLEALAGRPLLASLEALWLTGALGPDVLAHLAALPRLRCLGFEAWHHPPPPWLERIDFAPRLAELHVATNDPAAWLPRVRALGAPVVSVETYVTGPLRYEGDRLEISVDRRDEVLRLLEQTRDDALRGIATIAIRGDRVNGDLMRQALAGLASRMGVRIATDVVS